MTTSPIVWTKSYQSWLWNLKPGDIVQVNTSDLPPFDVTVVGVSAKRITTTSCASNHYTFPRRSPFLTSAGRKVWISQKTLDI